MTSSHISQTDDNDNRTATDSTSVTVAFVCVQNAGRSQMATAFAKRERDRRDLDVEILTGGTHPAEHVHAVVVEAMAEKGMDISNQTPREISQEELRSCDHIATMGCSTLEVDTERVTVHDWGLEDPHGKDRETVRGIRDEVEERVTALLDQIIRRD